MHPLQRCFIMGPETLLRRHFSVDATFTAAVLPMRLLLQFPSTAGDPSATFLVPQQEHTSSSSRTTRILVGVLVGVIGFAILKTLCIIAYCYWRNNRKISVLGAKQIQACSDPIKSPRSEADSEKNLKLVETDLLDFKDIR